MRSHAALFVFVTWFSLIPLVGFAQNTGLELPNIAAQPDDEIVVDVTVTHAVDFMGFQVVNDLPNVSNAFPDQSTKLYLQR